MNLLNTSNTLASTFNWLIILEYHNVIHYKIPVYSCLLVFFESEYPKGMMRDPTTYKEQLANTFTFCAVRG